VLKFKSFTRLYTTFLSFYQCMESLGPKEVRLWCTTQLYFDRRRLEDDFPSRPSPYRPPPLDAPTALLIEMLLLPADADADSDVCLLSFRPCPPPFHHIVRRLPPCRLSVRRLLLLSVVMFWAEGPTRFWHWYGDCHYSYS